VSSGEAQPGEEETMDKKVRAWGTVTLVLGLVCLSWVVFDIFAFGHIRARLHLVDEWGPLQQTLGGFVWIGYLVFFLFHVPALLTLIFRTQIFKRLDILQGGGFLLGLLSLFGLMGDFSLLNDIGRETRLTGRPQSEWDVLAVVLAVHALFFLLMIALVVRTFRRLRREAPAETAAKDEILFVTAQALGVVCGAAGLWVNFSFLAREIPGRQFVFLLPFYFLMLLPYGLAALAWFIAQRRHKPCEWYDEKQWRDIGRAALVTLLLSLPGMALLLLVGKPLGMFWFPHYIFLVLFLLSGTTLLLTFGRET
jgi:hypothetical protein